MKHNFYFYGFVVLLIAANLLLVYRLTNLEYKFETLREANVRLADNKDLNENQIEIRRFKEESYINQQERDTTLILFVFTLFASATAFISYKSFTAQIVNHTIKMEEKFNEHEAKSNEQHKKLKKLEKNLVYQSANNQLGLASKSLEAGDYKRYIMIALTACESYCKVKIAFDKDDNNFFVSAIEKIIKEQLKVLKEETDKLEAPLIIENMTFERFRERVDTISKAIDEDDFVKLCAIASKIKIESKDSL